MRRAASARPSVWWPTPAQPSPSFSDAEITASDAYNRPLRRVALTAGVARFVLLVAAALVAGAVTGAPLTQTRYGPALIGAGLTVVAMRIPSIAADAWFEYRHEPAVTGHQPSPVSWFALVVSVLTVSMFAMAALVGWLLYDLAVSQPRWPLIISAVIIASVVVVAAGERWVRHQIKVWTGRFDPHALDPLAADLDALADSFGLKGLGFTCEHSGNGAAPAFGGLDGPTAYTTGIGPNRRVVVSTALLAEPASSRRFVVAHELAHAAGRHVLAQTMVGTTTAIGFVWATAALVADGRPWSWFGLAPLDPCSLPVLALLIMVYGLVLAPVTSWLTRYHERRADLEAAIRVGPPEAALLRRLYTMPSIDLDPAWWQRLYGQHPPPAERIEFLKRLTSPDLT